MLLIELTGELAVYLGGRIICCGDFNVHSTLWDDCNVETWMVIKELMES